MQCPAPAVQTNLLPEQSTYSLQAPMVLCWGMYFLSRAWLLFQQRASLLHLILVPVAQTNALNAPSLKHIEVQGKKKGKKKYSFPWALKSWLKIRSEANLMVQLQLCQSHRFNLCSWEWCESPTVRQGFREEGAQHNSFQWSWNHSQESHWHLLTTGDGI